jgi:hypothetical protein
MLPTVPTGTAVRDWEASDPVEGKRIMHVQYRRAALAAVLTAAAVAVPVAAFASGPGSPPTKSVHSPIRLKTKSAAGASNSGAASQLSGALAASAGISQSGLDTGLAAAKRAGGDTSAGITDFAQAAGVSHATAQRIVYAVFGKSGAGAPDRIKEGGSGR